MLDVIQAVKAALQQRAELDYIRDSDIAIVPSLYHLPGDAPKFPCIGIKDGPVKRREGACCTTEATLVVQVVLYTRLQKDEERSVVGDGSTGRPGILQVAADVCQVLRGNLLGLAPELQAALVTAEEPSGFYLKEDGTATQRKLLTFTYTKETQDPCGN